jgi:D-alanine-D-alanine ligase
MKKNIAFLTGGYSGEAAVSYKSAIQIERNLDTTKFNIYKIDITLKGWFYCTPDGKRVKVNKNDFTVRADGKTVRFDGVFIGIHGTPGEDGKLQGYFDMLKIPYTTCDATTSALTMSKRYTVAIAAFAGIRVAKSVHLFKDEPMSETDILAQLNLPFFVKPNNGGSSIGMSKVDEITELAPALEKAFKEDTQILVEEFIKGREFTIGVFKRKTGEVIPLPITEIVSFNEFFDYEAKYLGKSEEFTPANLEEHLAKKIRAAALKAYQVFNCNGVVRIDFILHTESGEPYMLEINTIPGQTEASVIPMQVRAMGWNLQDFYTEWIEGMFV